MRCGPDWEHQARGEGVTIETLFDEVVGQESAVAMLRAAVPSPVHAYLFRGPAGHGGLAASRAFAAALLCAEGGCGVCQTCLGALAGGDPELATVASRCVEVDFPPVPPPAMVQWLRQQGVDEGMAAVVADSSGGSPGRARVMLDDPEVAERAALWASVPSQLNGSGTVAADLARRLLASADRATEPLRAEHGVEVERLTAEAKDMGEKSLAGRKEITDQQQREERRWRTDALRAGLGALSRSYRDRTLALVGGPPGDAAAQRHALAASEAVTLISQTARVLPRNPNEALLLQSLLVRLGALEV
jgi:DNA polymerase-3 subunit delta'